MTPDFLAGSPLDWLFTTSVAIVGLAVVVTLVERLGRRRLPPRAIYALWILVGLRLVMVDLPALPGGGVPGLDRSPSVPRTERDSGPLEARPESTRESLPPLGHPSAAGPALAERTAATFGTRNRSSRYDVAVASDPSASLGDTAETNEDGAAVAVRARELSPPLAGTLRPSEPPVGVASGAAPDGVSGGASSLVNALFVLWIVGALAWFLRAWVRDRRFCTRLDREAECDDPRVLEIVGTASGALRLRRSVRVVVTDLVRTPASAGVRRPVVLLTPRAVSLSDDDLRNVVLHELAHVKRHDLVANWVMVALQSVHWFNPFAHYALSRLRATREVLRDFDALAAQPGQDPLRYARTFLQLVSSPPPPQPSPVVGLLHGHGEVRKRILMIRSFDHVRSRRVGLLGVGLFVLLAWASFTQAERPEPAAPVQDGGKDEVVKIQRHSADPEWWVDAQAKLDQTVELHIEAITVSEFANQLRELTGMNVVLTQEVSHDADDWIIESLSGKGALRHLMARALRPLDLDFSLFGRALVIGGEGEIPRLYDLRFYRVEHLLRLVANHDDDEYYAVEQLIELVEEVTSRERQVWDGEHARMYQWQGLLCVSQTAKVHVEIHRFLEALTLGTGGAAPESPEAQEIRELLRRDVSLDLDAMPLVEAMRFLTAASGVPIVVDEDYREEIVHLTLNEVTGENILGWLQTLYGIRSTIEAGAVYVGERPRLTLRVHNVSDLLRRRIDPQNDHLSDRELFSHNVEQLRELIVSTVHPSAWDEGDPFVNAYGDRLVIMQTPQVHRDIEQFLASIRSALR
ncbi:MAG: M56 family metallopeptidase [Planctomycetota bacterium]